MPSHTFHGNSITFKEIRKSRIRELISHYEEIYPADSSSSVRGKTPRKISSPCLPRAEPAREFKKGGKSKSSSDSESSPVTKDLKIWIEPHQYRPIGQSMGPRPTLERRKPVSGPHPQLKKRPLQVIEVKRPSGGGQSTSISANKNRISNLKIFYEENDRKSKHESMILSGHYSDAKTTNTREPKKTDETHRKEGSSLGSWTATGLRFKSTASALGFMTSCGFTSDEMTEAMAARYGDSETESEDEDDDDLMDSVSVVAARNAVTIASLTHTKDTDSGRGESPESLSGGRVVLRPKTTPKGPRPISAVPSEYSDISTSSCRSSDGGGDHVEEACPPTPILSPKESLIEEPIAHEEEEDYASKMKRVRMIAMELLTTEEQYVQILHLIDQVFHFQVDQENRSQNLFPPETIPQMFANIKSIYQFHEEFLLPQLRERMAEWDTSDHQQRIGDIIVKFSPFFKMYTEYVKNFDNAISTINNLYQKNSKFASIMDKIHAMPECRSLSLQHHMLTPVQRIPRYEMLLKGYLHKLPQDSPDRENAEKALHLVSTAATHANEAMRRIEKFKQLLEVQESLGGTVDLVSPTRELVKEGKMVKISARSGDHQDRYIFLFSDIILLCSQRLIANRVIAGNGAIYKLRARFDVDNIQVLEGDNLVTANTFYIKDDKKCVELYTQTREEKRSWLEALYRTMEELYQKKSSLRVGIDRETLRPLDHEIGVVKPNVAPKAESCQKCMRCGHPFTMMRKKHQCRACGIVICSKCSNQKFPLAFEGNKLCRVCRTCYEVLVNNQKRMLSDAEKARAQSHEHQSIPENSIPDVAVRPKGLLEVPGNSPCIHNGYMVLKGTPGSSSSMMSGSNMVSAVVGTNLMALPSSMTHKTGSKRWFVLLYDFVLYSFKAQNDSVALTALPLPGYTVSMGLEDLQHDPAVLEKDKERTIRIQRSSLCHSTPSTTSSTTNVNQNNGGQPMGHASFKKVYYLVGLNVEDTRRWFEVLELASRAELPSCCSADNSQSKCQ